jgi:hypothetical protein
MSMHNKQHDVELGRTILLGLGLVMLACSSLWLLGFAVAIFR